MNTPLISIVVIGYNIDLYIDKCLESIIKQSYTNFELIFVDDGSKDNTLKIAKKFNSDRRLQVIAKQNGGIVSARKAGVRIATGDYIMFVDGDDWLNYDMLESLVATLNSTNQIVDIVSTNMYRQEEDGSFFIQQQNYNNNICEGKTYFELIMRDKVNHHMFPKLYRREFVLSAGYLDYPEVTMAEDLMTNSLFGIHNPKVLFSNSTNYYYRYNATSVMRSGDNVLLSQIFTLKKMEEYFKKHNVYNEIIELLDYQWFSYVFTYTHTNVHYNMKKEIVNNCRSRLKGYLKNRYCKELLKEYSKNINLQFYCYYYLPILAPIIDNLLHILIGIKKYYRRK